MQNWSCGYYLLYFAPFVPLFVVHRMWTEQKLKDLRIWMSLAGAALVALALTLPFLLPYQQAQQVFGFARPFGEVVQFSANVWSYVTASENLTLFGRVLRYYPRGEGETFLGFIPWLLAAVAVSGTIRLKPDASPSLPDSNGGGASAFRRIVPAFLLLAVVTQLIGVLSVVLFGGFEFGVISARTPQRLLVQFAIALALLLAISPRARIEGARMVRSPIFFALVATVLAVWLSLGPLPHAGESRASGFGLYGLLYDYVPGFNGVRVPARYAMIAGLFLAILAGFGMLRVLSRAASDTVQIAIVSVFSALILLEGAAIPIEMNRTWSQYEAMPPARVYPLQALAHRSLGEGVPPVYARIAALPAGAAITEFPFGDAAWEIRYTYYAAAHWKPITNGYSGSFPPRYTQRLARLRQVTKDPEAAWQSLKDSGSTHVIVHRNAFANAADADTVENWLKAHGARELERFPDNDILLSVN